MILHPKICPDTLSVSFHTWRAFRYVPTSLGTTSAKLGDCLELGRRGGPAEDRLGQPWATLELWGQSISVTCAFSTEKSAELGSVRDAAGTD